MVPPLIKKSDENWLLSEQLRSDGKLNAAANRLYYSIFQAIKAYAVKSGKMENGDKVSVHRTANRIVKDEKKDYRTFGDAMDMRERGDYEDDSVSPSEFSQKFLHDADTLRLHYRNLAVGQ